MKKNELINFIDIEEAKKIAFNLLIELKNICEKNNINYFLGAGTLLGAVRHKGFIPWDDDIDIFMFRNDYEKFISIVGQEKSSNYELLHYSLDKDYLFPWAKLCDKRTIVLPSRFFNKKLYGVAIDIFPIDELKGNSYEDNLNYSVLMNKLFKKKYVTKYCPFTNGKSFKEIPLKYSIKKLKYMFSNIIHGKINTSKFIKDFEKKLKENKSEYLGFVFDIARKEPFITRKEYFLKSTKLTFENQKFNAPYKYDEVLKDLYGNDYMKLPKKDMQVRKHNGKIFFVESKR